MVISYHTFLYFDTFPNLTKLIIKVVNPSLPPPPTPANGDAVSFSFLFIIRWRLDSADHQATPLVAQCLLSVLPSDFHHIALGHLSPQLIVFITINLGDISCFTKKIKKVCQLYLPKLFVR